MTDIQTGDSVTLTVESGTATGTVVEVLDEEEPTIVIIHLD